jgi:hypothetical protein
VKTRLPFHLTVIAIAGLASWAAFQAGKGKDAVAAMLAAKPDLQAKASARETRTAPRLKDAALVAEIQRLVAKDLANASIEEQLAAWEIIRSLSMKQVKEALKITGTTANGEDPNFLAMMLYTRWSEIDPAAAVKSAAELPDIPARIFGGGALWNWVKSDPEAAYLWCKDHAKFAEYCQLDSMMAAMLAAEPPASALEKASLLDGQALLLTSLHLALHSAPDEDARAGFIAAAAKLPEKMRNDSLLQMARAWSLADPEAALAGVDGIFEGEDLRMRARSELVRTWGTRDPQQALAWLGVNPPPDLVDQQAGIWKRWVTEQPDAANRWLSQHGEPPALAETIVRQIQSRTLNTTLGIGNKSAKREAEALRRNYRAWSAAQPQQAAEWLKKADPKIALTITSSAP